ncbi:MAG: PLDc N-terminal domain-containing protein [Actinomycetia bacterium]|nr:PLDc N-terminal domain-containing protein [Actinomycetes bacterium]
MNTATQLSDLPAWAVVVLGLLALTELALDIYALVRLARTPDERLVFGKKWPWVLLILLVNLIGAILFLVVGRKPEVVADPLRETPDSPVGSGSVKHAADVLYGPRDGE